MTTLRFRVSDPARVPAEFRDLYAAGEDGAYILQIDGAADKRELIAVRDDNLARKRQLDEMTARFDGFEPEVWRDLLRQEQLRQDLAAFEAGRGDEVIAARTEAERGEHARLLATLTAERDAMRAEFSEMLLCQEVEAAATAADVLPGALDDVLLRAREVFRVVDGRLAAFQGEAPLVTSNGQPASVHDWLASLDAPHWYAPSQPGWSLGGSHRAAGQGNTITRAQWERLSSPAERRNAALNLKII